MIPTKVILMDMKTAISLPDDVFRKAEKLARRLRLSRSRLYAEALREYIARRDEREITRRLNAVYAHEDSTVDPVLMEIALRSIPPDTWK